MAIATGVLWVKLDKDSSTQSRTMEDWPVAWRVWKTLKGRSRKTSLELGPFYTSLIKKFLESKQNETLKKESVKIWIPFYDLNGSG